MKDECGRMKDEERREGRSPANSSFILHPSSFQSPSPSSFLLPPSSFRARPSGSWPGGRWNAATPSICSGPATRSCRRLGRGLSRPPSLVRQPRTPERPGQRPLRRVQRGLRILRTIEGLPRRSSPTACWGAKNCGPGTRLARQRRAKTYCIATSGRRPTDADFERLLAAVARIKEEGPLGICLSPGLLTAAQARQARAAASTA